MESFCVMRAIQQRYGHEQKIEHIHKHYCFCDSKSICIGILETVKRNCGAAKWIQLASECIWSQGFSFVNVHSFL